MSDQPPPSGRHTLSEVQHLMGHLRAAQAGGAEQVDTERMVRLADLLTQQIADLKGDLAKSETGRSHAEALVSFYKTVMDSEKGLGRQIEKATPKQPTEDGGES